MTQREDLDPNPATMPLKDIVRLSGLKPDSVVKIIRKQKLEGSRIPSGNGRERITKALITTNFREKFPGVAEAWLLERQRDAEQRFADQGISGVESQKLGDGKRFLSLTEIMNRWGEEKLAELNQLAAGLREVKECIGRAREQLLAQLGIRSKKFPALFDRLEKYGVGGLLRPIRSDKGKSEFNPEIINFITDAYCTKKHTSVRKIWEMTVRFTKEKAFPAPSEKTVSRFIKDISNLVKVYTRRGNKEYRDRMEPIGRRMRVLAPGVRYCADHHQLDISAWNQLKKTLGLDFVRDEDRPWITVVMDLYNNDVVGWVLTWQPNAESIALALRRAFLFRGICQELLIDNGKDYLSARIEAVCASPGIIIRKCERYHGKSKPLERWFRILEERLISELAGYVGNKPANRPENVKAELELIELERVFDLWNSREYRNMKSKALGNKSPNELWVKALADGHVPRIPDVRSLDLLLMISQERKVFRDGIRLLGFYYWNDLLTPLINDTDGNGENRKVEVRYDPTFLGEIYVFVDGKFFCVAHNEPLADWGAKKEDLERVMHKRKYARNFVKGYLETARIGHSGQELIQETIQERLEREQPVELPQAVGQDKLHVFLPPFDAAARAIARGEGRTNSATSARQQREEIPPTDWFGTPDENNVLECGDRAEMFRRYRKLNFLDHRLPLRYLDPNRNLEHQVWQPEKLSADVRNFFKQRGLYKED